MADQTNRKSKNTTGGGESQSPDISPASRQDAVPNISAAGAAPSPGTSGSSQASSGGTAAATARSFYDQAKETAGQAYEVVTDKAATKLDEQKSTLTDGLSTVAQTIRQAGDSLGGGGGDNGLTQTAAKYTDTAAQRVEQVAQYFQQRDVKQMVRDLEGYAKRNPAVFVGAAFFAGVLLSRFLKAGTPSFTGGDSDDFSSGFDNSGAGLSGSGSGTAGRQNAAGGELSGDSSLNRA